FRADRMQHADLDAVLDLTRSSDEFDLLLARIEHMHLKRKQRLVIEPLAVERTCLRVLQCCCHQNVPARFRRLKRSIAYLSASITWFFLSSRIGSTSSVFGSCLNL